MTGGRRSPRTSGKAAAGFVVAIGREYGSGGREIGRKLADQLGYAFYDDEIIRRAAGTTGYSTKLVEEQEESMTSGVLYDLLTQMYTYAPAQESPKDAVFAAERSIILDVVRKGNCVIVGPLLRLDSARRSALPACLDPSLGAGPHCPHHGVRSLRRRRPGYHGQRGSPARRLLSVLHPPRLGPGPATSTLRSTTTLGYDYARETIAGALKALQSTLAARA